MAWLYKRSGSPYFWMGWKNEVGKEQQESTRCRINVPHEIRRAKQLCAEKSLEELRYGETRSSIAGWLWVPEWIKVRYCARATTQERYLCEWATLRLFFEERKIESPAHLTRAQCFDFMTWRQNDNAKGKGKYGACHNTALLGLKILRIIMNEAVDRKIIEANPCSHLGIKQQAQKVKPELSAEDCAKIRDEISRVEDLAIRQMLSMSFEIARYQGCRLAETRLNPQTDVRIFGQGDEKHGQITFRIKGGRTHTTLLHPALLPLFEQLKAEGKTATWQTPDGLGRQWASAKWWKFLERIGLKKKGITFHSTRVTVVTEMARKGVPENKAQKYVGHSSTTVHRVYQRLRVDDLNDCAGAIG